MRGREAMTLFTFGLIVSLSYHWHLLELQTIPPVWISAVELLGAFGLSALLSSLLWRIGRGLGSADDEVLPNTEKTAEATTAPHLSETPTDLEHLRESGLVDADWYARTYPNIAAQGLDAADHYLHHGAAEGRNPSPFFETRWYLDHNPDVREAGINPLMHYLNDGASEGRAAGPEFDTAFYQAENDDVRNSAMNPLAHYLRMGRLEGRRGTAKG